jgi:carboxyl-terminal processing protease
MRIRPVVAFVAGAVLTATATGFFLEEQSTRDAARLFDQVLSTVARRFVDSVDTSALYEKAAHGLVEELNDPYSELLPPKEAKQFNTSTGGRYGGVGMLIEDQQGAIVISRVYPNTPAERAGIHEGDRILEIDGAATRGWKTSEVSEKMQGVPDTKVSVKFARPGVPAPIAVTFTRATIRIPALPYAIMLDGNIAYLPLQTFNETAAREVANQLERFQRDGAKGFVLDLRGNQGGFLDQALAIANLFLKPGQEIASVRSRRGDVERYVAEFDPVAPSVPLVILTDGGSASASEIVAGALQDHDRALILGTTSFGKGLVQSMLQLDEPGWFLKLTTGKWYTPSGRSIHKAHTVSEVETDTAAHEDVSKRPVYKSDAGRTVYGGGAVTPDVFVRPDTITSAERVVAQKLLTKSLDVHIALADLALQLKDSVRVDFKVATSWSDELYRRVKAKGVDVSKPEWDAGRSYADRELANRIARLAFGDSTTKRREISDDTQLLRAMDLLRRGRTQADLFALAAAQPRARQE